MKHCLKKTTCLFLALILTAGLLSGLSIGASAASITERQKAIVDVAWAYYDKGHSIQYDGTALVTAIDRSNLGKSRSTNQVAPEYATPNETMYTVCSDFAHQVYWEAYRYQLIPGGTAGSCWTGSLMNIGSEKDTIKNNPICLYRWDEKVNTDVPVSQALTELLALCQPGDLITVVRRNGSGHTMVYVGDVLGDGKAYLLHSTGSHLSTSNQHDVIEYKKGDDSIPIDTRIGKSVMADSGGGSINLSDAEAMLRKRYERTTDAAGARMNLLRPLVSMSESEYPITAATKYRMSHPRLAINRTLNKTRFNSAYTGETVTMTLELKNNSKQDYTVPVTEKAPAGAKIKTPFAGANLAGDTMTLDVALKAGETKTLTAEYEITAKLGEQVVFDGGSVGDIPSNTIPVTVGGAKLTADDQAKLSKLAAGEYNAALKEAKATSRTLGDFVYRNVLGIGVQIPEYKTVASKYIKAVKTQTDKPTHTFLKKDEVKAEDLETYRMLVPACQYGRDIWLQTGLDRCSDPRDKHLEPGDIVVRADDLDAPDKAKVEQLVYLGNGKYLSCANGHYSAVEEPEFFKSILWKVFYVLRPTLAYDDVHTMQAAQDESDMKFTDVNPNDWYYAYVADLYNDSVISGMTATTFAPNGTLTYGQALKLITLIAGEADPVKTGSHWASGYLTLAKSKGWLTEDVNLDGTITRLALCKIAAKAKKLTAQPETNPFKDTDDKDVLALVKAGVINGMTDTTFQPNGLLTRAQISKIIGLLRVL